MNSKSLLAIGITALIFAPVLIFVASNKNQPAVAQGPSTSSKPGEEPRKAEASASRDWTMYGGSLQRNFVNTRETGLPEKWDVEAGTNIKWMADLGSMAYGGPTVADGKIFVGTNNEAPRNPAIKGDKGIIMCFRESDGKFLWQAVHDKLRAGRVNDWPMQGICSSPIVEGNKLWYVSNRCELCCADVEGDGKGGPKFYWKLDMIDKYHVFPHNLAVCSPLIVGDYIYLVTANGVDEGHINIPEPDAPSFLCVNKNTGDLVWMKNFPSEALAEAKKKGGAVDIKKLVDSGRLLMHGQWSNPVYASAGGKSQIIFPGGDGWIYSFEPKKGTLLWKFDCNPKDSFYSLGGKGTRNDFIGTPVVWENKLYIGVGQDPEHKEGVGHLWCIDITKDPKNQDRDVSARDKDFDPKAAVNKDSALVWHYGGLAPKGSSRPYLFGRTMSTAAVHDGLLYISELGGYFHCFDANTGKHLWDHDMESQTWSSPFWVDGKVLMGNDDGKVYVFAHGKEKKILAEIEMNARVRTTPVAANGCIYMMTENPTRLIAIAKGATLKK